MGYTSHSADNVFDAAVAAAESTRQAAVAGASQASVNAAEITFYRAVKALQVAKGYSTIGTTLALQQLGTGGN